MGPESPVSHMELRGPPAWDDCLCTADLGPWVANFQVRTAEGLGAHALLAVGLVPPDVSTAWKLRVPAERVLP